MGHLRPLNRKAQRIAAFAAGDVHAQAQTYPFGCTTIFSPGWETDSAGGTSGLCAPIERDLYDCYKTCFWPAQVPDYLVNYPNWAAACGAPVQDWRAIDLVFP